MWFKLAFLCYASAVCLAISFLWIPSNATELWAIFIAGLIACGGIFTLQLIQNVTILLTKYTDAKVRE